MGLTWNSSFYDQLAERTSAADRLVLAGSCVSARPASIIALFMAKRALNGKGKIRTISTG
jgi:hypothetical protein